MSFFFSSRLRRLLGWLALLLWPTYILLSEPIGYALFLLSAILLHETGHIFAFLVLGEPLPSLVGRRLGLLLTPRRPFLSYGREIFICAAGPLFNLLAAAALIPALRGGHATDAHFCFFTFHLFTALFNLLPIEGFDGGRILFAVLSLAFPQALAEKTSVAFSLLFTLVFYFTGIYLCFLARASIQPLAFSLLLLAGEGKRHAPLFTHS